MRLAVLPLLLLLALSFTTFAEVPSLDDMESAVENRLRSYDGIEFSISSNFHQEDLHDDPKMRDETISLKNIKETVRLHFPEKGQAWKYWVQEVQDSYDRQWIISRFKVTNVLKTHDFRFVDEMKARRRPEWSHGNILPFHDWNEENGRAFFTALSIDTIGFSLLDIGGMHHPQHREFLHRALPDERLNFVREYVFDGQKALVFTATNKQAEEIGVKRWIEFHIVYPQGIIIHHEFINDDPDGKRVFHVEKIAKFENIWYPQKGTLYQDANILSSDKYDYQFEVTSVRRFEPALLQNWFPDWPAGTNIGIYGPSGTAEEIKNIPHSERQTKKWEGLTELKKLIDTSDLFDSQSK